MKTLRSIEAEIEDWQPRTGEAAVQAGEILHLAEEVLENWLIAHQRSPTEKTHEGSRLLALHRQAAKGDPSFNACRETCREVAYRFNLIAAETNAAETTERLVMMRRLAHHLVLFISGKMEFAQLGEFCCASRPIREAEPQAH